MIAPTLEDALRIHDASGYVRYKGPLLEGPRHVIAFGTAAYPSCLSDVRNPPDALYCIGDPAALAEGIAVVGARRATPYGRACCAKFSRIAAERGIPVISGGARGCDSEAHRAALACNATTVAVLGGGCDQLYPKTHHRLFQQIIDSGGAVVSEHEWGYPALPFTFRERNRIIAGMGKATLIVEAGLPSGTFSTADEALAANRDVLVVPGAITSPTSAGSNMLLYQGACPVVDEATFCDALDRIFALPKGAHTQKAGPYDAYTSCAESDRDLLLEALLAEPLRMNEIFERVMPLLGGAGDPMAHVHVHLAELERDKLIARYPDGRYGPRKA